ncbi:predicted protein [Plenodomus lingam JN3]|uniref:Predicted protein n=1 Tax=Leptosphaeria maculans (strain JN3 / isolate v23.1.3 / race Av1-4-5-6-7-8) TaxID=985895 RepID=E5A3R9_LEPMJ|nr:predicted protein [Plenodomus lingam JN3]CBX98282.1 predicted protein [Plenodomus lingam JN3]
MASELNNGFLLDGEFYLFRTHCESSRSRDYLVVLDRCVFDTSRSIMIYGSDGKSDFKRPLVPWTFQTPIPINPSHHFPPLGQSQPSRETEKDHIAFISLSWPFDNILSTFAVKILEFGCMTDE